MPSQTLSPTADAAGPSEMITVGWREWLAVPGLGIPAIKAKVDTGARTSALHTYFIDPFEGAAGPMVRFGLHPLQKRTTPEIVCEALVTDRRVVSDSGGHREERFFIAAPISLGPLRFVAELSLANRETMRFRMLLGRTAMEGRILVDPGASFLHGKALAKAYKQSMDTRTP